MVPDWYRSNQLLEQRNAKYLEISDRLAAEARRDGDLGKMLRSIALLRLYNHAEEIRWQQLQQQMELKGVLEIPQSWREA